MHKAAFWLEKKAAACFLRLLKKAVRIEVSGQPENSYRCVYAFWHRNLLILTLQRMNSGAAVLVSSSQDGELIAGPLGELGYFPVRGSTTRGGAQALKELVRLGRERCVAITPDGPKGPVGSIQPGIFQVAFLAGIPIVPIAAGCDREWVFNTWDRFRLPKPFSRIRVLYGPPIWVRDKDDFANAEERLRSAFSALEQDLAGVGIQNEITKER